MPALLNHLFPQGTRIIVYRWMRELLAEGGLVLIERGRVFAVGRAARYASFSSHFRVPNVFSASAALGQHAGQLWDPLLSADFPRLNYLLGRAALLAGEVFFFHAVVHLLEKMVSFFFVRLERRLLTCGM